MMVTITPITTTTPDLTIRISQPPFMLIKNFLSESEQDWCTTSPDQTNHHSLNEESTT